MCQTSCRECGKPALVDYDFCSIKCETNLIFREKGNISKKKARMIARAKHKRNGRNLTWQEWQKKKSSAVIRVSYREFPKKKERKKSFYDSIEWKQLRYLAIKTYGKRCFACGCYPENIHVDHIKPRSKYPKLALCLTNLQILCEPCNMGKGAWDETDWRHK